MKDADLDTNCIGCNRWVHLLCIGVTCRMTRQQQDEICGAFKYVCKDCNDLTPADMIRGIFKANQKVDDMRLETFKKHNEILGKINTIASALRDVLDDAASRDSSHSAVYDRLNKINDDFICARQRIEALDLSIETKVTELVTLSNDMASRHVRALNEILDKTIECQLSSTTIDPPRQIELQQVPAPVVHQAQFCLAPDDLLDRLCRDFSAIVRDTVSPISLELKKLQDDLDALNEGLSRAAHPSSLSPRQSLFEELRDRHLLDGRLIEWSFDLDNNAVEGRQNVDDRMALLATEFEVDIVNASVVRYNTQSLDNSYKAAGDFMFDALNGITLLLTEFDIDVSCSITFSPKEQLSILRRQNFKLVHSGPTTKKKKKERKGKGAK